MSRKMKPRSPRGRKILNSLVNIAAVISAVIGIVALFWITITVLRSAIKPLWYLTSPAPNMVSGS